MKHLFVSYEIALKLKEKGFDEPCLGWYWDKGIEISFGSVTSTELLSTACIAPTYQQVIEYLNRIGKEKHLDIYLIFDGFNRTQLDIDILNAIEKKHLN